MSEIDKNHEYLMADGVLLITYLAKILGTIGYRIDKSVSLDVIISVLKICLPPMEYIIAPTFCILDRIIIILIKKASNLFMGTPLTLIISASPAKNLQMGSCTR